MKHLIIDGHNLIPCLPGMALKDADDEIRLIEVVQEYCRLTRHRADVFFDGSPNPSNSPKGGGLVRIHFVKAGYSADDAIIRMVRSIRSSPEVYTVVSSDHRIIAAAASAGIKSMDSGQFSRELSRALSSERAVRERREKPLSSSEVNDWLEIFGTGDNS